MTNGTEMQTGKKWLF